MGNLLYWAVVFLVIALVAAVLGFGGVAGTAMAGAQMLFWFAIVLFVVSLVWGLFRRGRNSADYKCRPGDHSAGRRRLNL